MVAKTGCLLNSQAAGGISLRICVDQKNFNVAHGKGRAEVDGGRGLPHAAFLVGYCDDSTHVVD